MASQASDSNNSAADKQEDERARSVRYQTEFDYLIIGLILFGILLTIFYGASAKTCSPDPSQIASVVGPAPSPAGNGNVGGPPPPNANQASPTGGGTAGSGVTTAPTPRASPNQAGPATGPAPRPRCEAQGSSGFAGALLALAIALGALAIGAAVGFLFGLPRTLTSSDVREVGAVRRQAEAQNEQDTSGSVPAESGGGTARGMSTSDVNTNLEKISDWLTTIIVGVGLTKLEEIPSALESFGNEVAIYFGYGGKVFGIGGGLFFLIAGFFLSYVGTRVKLSLVFSRSQLDNRSVTAFSARDVEVAKEASISPGGNAAGGEGIPHQLQQADEHLLAKSLGDLKTNDEIIAWANAKARTGDFESALTAYKDVLRRVPLTEKLSWDYAVILAATGNQAAAQNVIGTLSATANLSPEARTELNQQVSAVALRERLRKGLYRWKEQGFEDSIAAGEALMKIDDQRKVAMNHVWLACAYGQKHAWIRQAVAGDAARQQELEELAEKATGQVEEALRLQPSLKQLLASLYNPALQTGNDNDLQSLFGHPRLDALLLD